MGVRSLACCCRKPLARAPRMWPAAFSTRSVPSMARYVTVSVGIGCYDDESECWVHPSARSRVGDQVRALRSPGSLVQAADQALYAAKHAGRAQARLLDIADVRIGGDLARDVAPFSGPSPALAQTGPTSG